jgi:hypothetical protein
MAALSILRSSLDLVPRHSIALLPYTEFCLGHGGVVLFPRHIPGASPGDPNPNHCGSQRLNCTLEFLPNSNILLVLLFASLKAPHVYNQNILAFQKKKGKKVHNFLAKCFWCWSYISNSAQFLTGLHPNNLCTLWTWIGSLSTSYSKHFPNKRIGLCVTQPLFSPFSTLWLISPNDDLTSYFCS